MKNHKRLKKNKYKRKRRWFVNYFHNARSDSDHGNEMISEPGF